MITFVFIVCRLVELFQNFSRNPSRLSKASTTSYPRCVDVSGPVMASRFCSPYWWSFLLGTQIGELKEYNLITGQVQNSIYTFWFQVKRQIFLEIAICVWISRWLWQVKLSAVSHLIFFLWGGVLFLDLNRSVHGFHVHLYFTYLFLKKLHFAGRGDLSL